MCVRKNASQPANVRAFGACAAAGCNPPQKSGSAIFLRLISLVENFHHVRQRAVLSVADDVRTPFLDLGDGVFGREADLGDLEHRNVIVVVADAVDVLARNAEELGKL